MAEELSEAAKAALQQHIAAMNKDEERNLSAQERRMLADGDEDGAQAIRDDREGARGRRHEARGKAEEGGGGSGGKRNRRFFDDGAYAGMDGDKWAGLPVEKQSPVRVDTDIDRSAGLW